MMQLEQEVTITRFNSENTQMYMFSNLPKRIEILEREQYLFLPTNWGEDQDLVALRFIAEQRGYLIEFANDAPKHSAELIFSEIEKAIEKVTGLKLSDYAIKNRTSNLFYARVIHNTIAIMYKIDKHVISKRTNNGMYVVMRSNEKHDALLKFTPEYRRMYNDVLDIIKTNQII